MTKTHIFVSYSRSDIQWVKEGEYNLIPWIANSLRNKGIKVWYDQELKKMPGEEYKKKIKEEIYRSDIAILLISQNFLNSEFIRNFEIPWIRERIVQNRLTIIPILVGRILWEFELDYNWLTDRQIIPGEEVPLIEYTNDRSKWDEARSDVLRSILIAAQNRQNLTTFSTIPQQVQDTIPAFGLVSNRKPDPMIVLKVNQRYIMHGSKQIVIASKENPPFNAEAIAQEQDTSLVLDPDSVAVNLEDPIDQTIKKAIKTPPKTPGSVIILNKIPLRLLAIIHDLNEEPSWREEWAENALHEIFQIAELRKIKSVELLMLGTIHGTLKTSRFVELLLSVLNQSNANYPNYLWLVVPSELQKNVNDMLELKS